jgi:hypothetical protein
MVKKITFISLVTLALVLIVAGMASAQASNNSTYVSVGYQDPMFNLSGALRWGGYGVEIGLGFRSYPEMLDYPCPHYNYTILDDYYYSALIGVDLLRYIDIGENCSLYAGAGLYLLGYDMVVQSNDTGWIYRQESTVQGSFAYSGGLQFHQNEGFGVGVGYHSLRGYNLQVLIRF